MRIKFDFIHLMALRTSVRLQKYGKRFKTTKLKMSIFHIMIYLSNSGQQRFARLLQGFSILLADYFKKKRENNKNLQYFYIEGVEKIEEEIINEDGEDIVNEYGEELINELEKTLNDSTDSTEEIRNECTDEAEQNLSEKIQNEFDFFQSMPDYLLVFCTANLDDRLQEKNITIKSLVQTPSNCYQVAADHIIGSRGNESVFIEYPRMAMTCLAIPCINGLDLFHFHMETQNDVISVPNDGVVKAILFFPNLIADDDHPDGILETLSNSDGILENLSNYSNESPVVGGSVDKTMTANSPENAFNCIALCERQGSRIDVASVVINSNITDENEIERIFRQLNVENAKFALMFSTRKKDTILVEMSVFMRVIPATPLFGFQSDVVFGTDSSDNLPKPFKDADSVFLIVCFQ